MLDFTSALYLGLRHPSASLQPWDALTLGRPSIVREPPRSRAVAAELAQLQGCEAATLLPSTLHLFWDLFRVLAGKGAVILRDASTYPIVRWGTERVAAFGIPMQTFAHHDQHSLEQLAAAAARQNLRPIVVADGYCVGCGRAAPISAYAEIALRGGGYLVLDDTQALGVMGAGGGGSLRWHGCSGSHIVAGSSLAKGFGAPLAVLAGGRELIERFRRDSETRVHCSPPSVAVIHAAQRALQINRRHGDDLRWRVISLALKLRQWLSDIGLMPIGTLPFPVQSFVSKLRMRVEALHEYLQRAGVATLLTGACNAAAARLTFILTARHRAADIEHAARVIAQATNAMARAS